MTSMQARTRLWVSLGALVVLGLFAAANTHLVWTSVQSQPECVSHLKTTGHDGRFQAAQPSC
ncbi:MAG TPA: hypothetical protein VIL84_05685 [Devosiaceae bacterium]